MKKIMTTGAMIALFALGTAAAYAATADKPASPPGQEVNDQVCPEGDSGKINVSGSNSSITVSAPEGMLISGYCVKAGSENQGLGPESVTVDPPAKTVTITHSSGKDISHYSLTFVDEGEETTETETTQTETTQTQTTQTETTQTETTQTETTQTETTSSAPAQTTPAVTQPDETTSTEETAAEEAAPVFTPPVAQKPREQPEAVAPASPTPTTAPQAAPFTP
jgi:hypothetical protein